MESRWVSRRHTSLALGGLIAFGTGFGFVEAAVAYYLRTVMGSPDTYSIGHYRVLLNLGFITFVSHLDSFLPTSLGRVEVAREAATILMLAGVAIAVGERDAARRSVPRGIRHVGSLLLRVPATDQRLAPEPVHSRRLISDPRALDRAGDHADRGFCRRFLSRGRTVPSGMRR
ncbi:MAG TPA: hypothetical protein VFN54_08405 [Acidimicrobiales bacterium]|nr:hypothetical protein [Acidimicrobiales bacterium]